MCRDWGGYVCFYMKARRTVSYSVRSVSRNHRCSTFSGGMPGSWLRRRNTWAVATTSFSQ